MSKSCENCKNNSNRHDSKYNSYFPLCKLNDSEKCAHKKTWRSWNKIIIKKLEIIMKKEMFEIDNYILEITIDQYIDKDKKVKGKLIDKLYFTIPSLLDFLITKKIFLNEFFIGISISKRQLIGDLEMKNNIKYELINNNQLFKILLYDGNKNISKKYGDFNSIIEYLTNLKTILMSDEVTDLKILKKRGELL